MRRLFLKLWRRRRLERDMQAEMAFHREMAKAGGNPVSFGNQAAIAEEARDLWRFTLVENLWRDVVYAIRSLSRQPALVASAMASLALGVGANATVFSLGTELLLSEPSVTDPASLVYVRDGGNSHADAANFEAVRASGLFADVAGQREEAFLNWDNGQETRPISTIIATKNFFATVGMPVALGRGIVPSDPDEVTVIAHHFWVRRLDRDPNVIGRSIRLDGRPFTIVGVLPASSRTLIGFGFAPDAYVPPFTNGSLAMYGRLRPEMSAQQTREAARVLGQRVDPPSQPPGQRIVMFANLRLTAIAGLQRLRDESQAMTVAAFFVAALTVMALVLLLACVNVAGLLLSRGAVRHRELAIRVALGASRRRLLQQLLVESVLLAFAGGMAGVLLAQAIGSRLSNVDLPLPLPIQLHAEPNWRVVSYAAVLAMAATLLCGILPALHSVRASLAPALHRERRLRIRRALLTVQVAVSFVVVTVALLFVRNLVAAASVAPGFDMMQTLSATATLSPRAYQGAAAVRDYSARALEALKAVPGIESAASVRSIPFNDRATRGHGVRWADAGDTTVVSYVWNAVTADYFAVMSIPIRQGRSFSAADEPGPRVVIVNQLFVDRYMSGRMPVGAQYVVDDVPPRTYQIVGVAGSVKTLTLGENEQPQLYELLPQINNTRSRIAFVVRTTGSPAGHIGAVQAAFRSLDPAVGVEVATMRSSMTLAFLPSQVGAALMSAAGTLGLLLVAVGLFGTMAFSVAQRTREIGLRVAIGATRASVVWLVIGDCARLVVIGTVLGAAAAWFLAQPLGAFLIPGLSPNDPLTFASVFAVIALTGLIATWTPARRAAAIDPAITLRTE